MNSQNQSVSDAVAESNANNGVEAPAGIPAYDPATLPAMQEDDADEEAKAYNEQAAVARQAFPGEAKAIKDLPVARKWTSTAGPIQTKKVSKALSDIQWEGNTFRTLSGIKGVDEHDYSSTVLCGSGGREDCKLASLEVGVMFDWTVTRANYTEILAEIAKRMEVLKANRPVTDNRVTPEERAAEIAGRAEEAKKREQAEAEKLAPFIAAFGQGEEIIKNDDRKAVLAVLTYDGSDPMSDYHNSHATVGCSLLLGWTSDRAETQSLARYFVSLYPQLRDIEFEWHTEKYSMGHGNYLRETVAHDLAPEIAATVKAYGGGAVNKGRWEIVFGGWQKSIQAIKGYPGTFAGQNTPSSLPQDERSSTGASGIVVRRNLAHDGVEISFPSKPDRSKIDECKAAGFRWSMRSKVWYKKFGAYAWAQAHRIAGIEALPESGGTAVRDEDDQGHNAEDEAAGLEPGTLANDRRMAEQGLTVARFASGAVVTQNSRGRCEDAPCCGCCT